MQQPGRLLSDPSLLSATFDFGSSKHSGSLSRSAMLCLGMQWHSCPAHHASAALPVAQSSKICRKAFSCRPQSLPGQHYGRSPTAKAATAQAVSSDQDACQEGPDGRPHFAQQILRFSAGVVLLLAGAAGLTRPALAANRYKKALSCLRNLDSISSCRSLLF